MSPNALLALAAPQSWCPDGRIVRPIDLLKTILAHPRPFRSLPTILLRARRFSSSLSRCRRAGWAIGGSWTVGRERVPGIASREKASLPPRDARQSALGARAPSPQICPALESGPVSHAVPTSAPVPLLRPRSTARTSRAAQAPRRGRVQHEQSLHSLAGTGSRVGAGLWATR